MSSFYQHVNNINNLQDMGFDVSNKIVNTEVIVESWDYDDMVETMANVIEVLQNRQFKVGMENNSRIL